MHDSIRRAAIAAVLTCALGVAAAPALAQSDGNQAQESDPGALAREGAEKLIRALQGLLELVPHYGVPRMEENGDIVIPRLDKPTENAPDGGNTPEEGSGASESGGADDTRT